jgi:hypothetical protein
MSAERPQYFAYLLRMWQEHRNGLLVWSASLEDPHTGERLGFADLPRLFAFLEQVTRPPDPP